MNWLANTIGNAMNMILASALLSGCAMQMPNMPTMPTMPTFFGPASEGEGCADSGKSWKELLACAQGNLDEFCVQYDGASDHQQRRMADWMDRAEGVKC